MPVVVVDGRTWGGVALLPRRHSADSQYSRSTTVRRLCK
jgi:hypothetical protein